MVIGDNFLEFPEHGPQIPLLAAVPQVSQVAHDLLKVETGSRKDADLLMVVASVRSPERWSSSHSFSPGRIPVNAMPICSPG